MPRRVILFVDAQNTYKGARDAFFDPASPGRVGQFDPRRLGELIASKIPFGDSGETREISAVRVYTGRPDSSRDPKSYAAHRRQCARWEASGVTVIPRTLRYPWKWPAEKAEEKGIDVALAIDFVVMAVEHAYDIGIIMSTDSDPKPALEYVMAKPNVSAEAAAWHSTVGSPELSIPGGHLWCHRLLLEDYETVADKTDYNIKR